MIDTVQRWWVALWRPRGDVTWDGVVRVSGLLALAAIPLTLWSVAAGGLVGFALVTIWVNGPISPLLPSTFEPILMLFGRVYNPWTVAWVAVAGTLYVEYLNYRLWAHVLRLGPFQRMQESTVVARVLQWFRRAPFLTIWICSWSPIPYWPVRFISPMADYDVRRHLLATFLGRLPRLWFFAALGMWWDVPMWVLVAISLSSIALALTVWGWKHLRRRAPAMAASGAVDG